MWLDALLLNHVSDLEKQVVTSGFNIILGLNVFLSYSHVHNHLSLQFTKTWKTFFQKSAKKRNRFLIFWREKSTNFSNIWINYNMKFIGAFEKHLYSLRGFFPINVLHPPPHFLQPHHFIIDMRVTILIFKSKDIYCTLGEEYSRVAYNKNIVYFF